MPNIEVFYLFVLVAAARAGLAAWIEGWYFYNYSFCPTGFIIKLSEELSPRNIGNTFSKVMIANHIFIIFNSHGFATKIAAHIQMDEQYFVADSMSIT